MASPHGEGTEIRFADRERATGSRQRSHGAMRFLSGHNLRSTHMQRRWWLAGMVLSSCLMAGGCVVAPPRARVVAVAPARVWVPGHWQRGVWVRGHWRYR